jgi:F0F1-type ATP synthase assembly protein I
MVNLTYEDREELIIAAVTGAVIGFVGGHLDQSQGFGMLVWVLVCAVIASGMVYYLRACR